MSATNPAPIVAPSPATNTPKAGSGSFLAALLSALLPGLGQLLVRRWRNGVFILVAYAALFLAYLWLRLPQAIIGVSAAMLGFIGLCVLAAWDAAYGGQRPETKPTQWWLAALLPAALLAGTTYNQLALRAAGFRSMGIPSTSMAPTLPQGSHLMVDSRYYRRKIPQRGDIIVFEAPISPGVVFLKRVIAVGGDTLKIEGDKVYVNGTLLSEPYARFEGGGDPPWIPPNTLPAGKLFVMGDNRHVSLDSRYPEFGLVDITAVRGKVIYALASLGSDLKKFN